MKPENVYKDESALNEKYSFKYLTRMKQNKYWKLGYEAGKHKVSKQENPYKLSPDILKLLRKRTYWEMGHDDAAYAPSKKRLREEAERQKKNHAHKHKHKHKHKH